MNIIKGTLGVEEAMDKHRVFLQQRKIRRLVAHAEEMRIACVRPELAWADAWPHLDDWFMPEAFFIWRGRCRPGIA